MPSDGDTREGPAEGAGTGLGDTAPSVPPVLSSGARPCTHLDGSEVLNQLLGVGGPQEDRAHPLVPQAPSWNKGTRGEEQG